MVNEKIAVDYGVTNYTNTSRLIFKGPCIVEAAHIAGDGADGDCQIYDGENVNGELKSHLEALSGTTFRWQPGKGSKFHNGIYIVVNAATTKVSITYNSIGTGPVK